MKRILFTLLFVAFAIGSILAAPLKNVPCTITQPNGEVIHCFVSGDEFFNYYHDANGYTIIMDAETGYYTYAVKVNGEILPSEYIVGQVEPSAVAALTPYVVENPERTLARRVEWERLMHQHSRPQTRLVNHGLMFNLVVFISFPEDTTFPQTYSQIDNMFNDTSSATVVSMKNFFTHVSYNQFSIHTYLYPQAGPNDVIISYHDSHSENYYKPHSGQNAIGYTDDDGRHVREMDLLEGAIDYINNFIPSDLNLDYNNDHYVDNVVFVVNSHESGWSDLLWPHRSIMYDRYKYINGKRVYDYNLVLADSPGYFDVSTLCHEMFHSLSAPDLYLYNRDPYNPTTFVGLWDLMENNARPPQNMGAYMKMKYGHWIEEIPEAETTGLYTIYPVATSPHCAYKIYADRDNYPYQYIVIEFRNQDTDFDGTVYGSGAVIYRINTEFEGNAPVNFVNYFPEVFAFRPDGWPSQSAPYTFANGNLEQSYFGDNRREFSEYTNPYPFYCNGTTMTGFRITNITNYGDSLQFYLVKGNTLIDTFPWREAFEAVDIPYYCYNEYVNNYTPWRTKTGNNSGTINAAHSGSTNAMFYSNVSATTKLVLPTFDFTFLQNPTLSFWYGQASGSNYSLKVYYRQSPSDEWTLLQSYSSFTGQWTQASLNLPNPSATYQIAFESGGINGTGLVLDDIVVSGVSVTDFTITASAGDHGQISPSGAIQVQLHGDQTFTLTPEQGYTVDELLVDGESQDRALIYTFEDVVADHAISASFKPATNHSLNTFPASLYFSVAGGETSETLSVNVVVNDFMNTEDVLVQSEEPFLVSNGEDEFGLQTTIPYNGGMVLVVFAPPFGGNYYKTMTISNQELTTTVNLNGMATGIEEQQSESVQLYPNPASDKLNFVFKDGERPEKVEIVDVCGRTVLSFSITEGTTTVNTSGLEAGVYFVKADNIVKKFIKK